MESMKWVVANLWILDLWHLYYMLFSSLDLRLPPFSPARSRLRLHLPVYVDTLAVKVHHYIPTETASGQVGFLL